MALYRQADEVREIAEDLIDTVDEHSPLKEAYIVYLFLDKVPVKNGRFVLGRARKISGLPAFLTGQMPTERYSAGVPYFVVEIAQPVWEELKPAGRRALVDHELMHLVVDHNDAGEVELSTRGHDFEEFTSIIRRHGLWAADVVETVRAMAEQLSLQVDQVVNFANTGSAE